MSIITNTLPVEGETATATTVNRLFTDVQTATTTALNSQNLAAQSLDTGQFNLAASTGEAGILLVDVTSATIGDAATVTVPVQAAAGAPTWSVVTGELSYGASGLVMSANQVFRVYYNLQVDNKNYNTPFVATGGAYDLNFYAWIVWLEYANAWDGAGSQPTGWTLVPGQEAFSNTLLLGGLTYYVTSLDKLKASAIVPHAQYFDNGGTNTRSGQYLDNFNGQYYLSVGGSQTWYGLRLRIGGVVQTLGNGADNYLAWQSNNGFNTFNSIVYGQGNITSILQWAD